MEISDKDTSTLGLLFNEAPLLIRKQLAVRLGLNEAIILQQIHFHIQNKYKSVKERDRKRDFTYREETFWTYNGYKEWQQDEFPFLSVRTVERTFTNLEKKGILRSGVFNDSKADRKKWYTINYPKLLEEETAENVDTKQSAKLADSDAEQSANLADSDAEQSANLAESNPPIWQNPICQIGGIITKTTKEIPLDSSSSSRAYENIDLKLQNEFPDVPFEQIKNNLLNDDTAVIESERQYEAMLRYRLKNYKPKKEFTPPAPRKGTAKKPIRTELLPDWFDEEQRKNDLKAAELLQKAVEERNAEEWTEEEKAAKKKELDDILADIRKQDKKAKDDLEEKRQRINKRLEQFSNNSKTIV